MSDERYETCPFCGKSPKKANAITSEVACRTEDCPIKDKLFHAEGWNKRASMIVVDSYRETAIRIHRPEMDGSCHHSCPLRIGHKDVDGCKAGFFVTFRDKRMYPGKGCPWYEEDEVRK